MEKKTFYTNCKVLTTTEEEGVLEAIVNVFNVVDRVQERTILGLFEESLKKFLPKGVWAHDWDKPIAKTLEARELPPNDPLLPDDLKPFGGLYIKAQFFKDISDSWQAYLKIKNGLIDEFSIGYSITEYSYNQETEVTDLLKGEWYEWSPVLVGANQFTTLVDIKNLQKGILDMSFEDHSKTVLDAVEGLIKRYGEIAEKRLEDKPHLSANHIERIKGYIDTLNSLLEKGLPNTQPTINVAFEMEKLRYELFGE